VLVLVQVQARVLRPQPLHPLLLVPQVDQERVRAGAVGVQVTQRCCDP